MQPKDPLCQYTDVIILLTDGLNTQNRWNSKQTDIDDRQAITCANIKAANVDLNGEHRWRSNIELREQHGQVLTADVGGPDDCHL